MAPDNRHVTRSIVLKPVPTPYDGNTARRKFVQAVDFLILLTTVLEAVEDGDWFIRNPFKPPQKIGDVLSDRSPFFYGALLSALENEVVLTICRLTDPKEKPSGKYLNERLTLERIVTHLSAITDSSIRKELDKLVYTLRRESRVMRKVRRIRDNVLGHAGLPMSLNLVRKPRLRANEIDKIAENFSRIIEIIRSHYPQKNNADVSAVTRDMSVFAAILKAGVTAVQK